ncbi:MAG: SH3 domain-containing protein [Myxococcaceae bacterium]|jgi:hypothetical protein|nr:SH3 domain-containing protein [Myxococcaceae bacterium]MCA3013629.1 SH3 domain-containing protein [Myxococcaceae bacterium]
MHRRLLLPTLGALLLGPAALAVKPGGTLYVRSKDTKVLEKADAKAKQVTALQPSTEVIWHGPDAQNRQFHRVESVQGSGFTLQANLSPSKPQAEHLVRDNGAPIDPQAFASSGAATRALSGGALKVAQDKPDREALARALISVEATAKAVDPKDAVTFVQKRTQGGGGK